MSSSLVVLKKSYSEPYLLIDSGNSRLKASIYQNNTQVSAWIFENSSLIMAQDTLSSQSFSEVLMVGSSSLLSEIRSWFPDKPVRLFSHKDRCEITWAYDQPDRLGTDRMAALMGANALFPGQNLCVIQAGTCITVDFLRKDKVHLGGFISPGLQMRLKAMHQFTSGLPHVSLNQSDRYPGVDTESCLSGGAVWGIVMEIEGHFGMSSALFSGAGKLIICGGDAEFLAQRIKADNFVAPNLVLEGLNAVITKRD